MRFKNLTITLTLTCLSIVALVTLTLLPITNGICEWTGDKHSKSYTNSSVDIEQIAKPGDFHNWSKDTQMGRGWFLNASLYAGRWNASAGVFPAIYGIEDQISSFTPSEVEAGGGVYGGTANVKTERKSGWVTIIWSEGAQPQTYFLEGDVNSNENEERSLLAQVQLEKWYELNGTLVEENNSSEHESGVEASATAKVKASVYEGEVALRGHYTFTHTNGKKYTANDETKVERQVVVEGPSKTQKKDLSTFGLENKASLDFQFSGHSGCKSVSWEPADYDSGGGSGGD